MELSERCELSGALATLTRWLGKEDASHKPSLTGGTTGPKIWLIVGAVIAVAVVVMLVVLYGVRSGSGTGGTGGY